MTALSSARDRKGSAWSGAGSTPGARIPFGIVDEVSRHGLREDEPESVHIEVHLPGRLEIGRLRTAFGEALRRHPRILMREVPGTWYRRRYEWELTEEPDVEPVQCPPSSGPDALARARTRALTDCPSLATSPPVRLEVVTDSGSSGTSDGCVLLLTFHHTALDVLSCLRVLATAAELYGGAENPPRPAPVRSPASALRSGRVETSWPKASPWARSARILPAPLRPGGGRANGLLVAEFPLPHRAPDAPYTVNDQLLVATALTVARWNRRRGSISSRPVRITMPVDDRSCGAEMPIGNGTRLVDVVIASQDPAGAAALRGERPAPEAVASLLRGTARQTRALKATPRPQLARGTGLLSAPVLPVGLRSVVMRGLRRAAAPWMSTVLLSNVGRVPYPFDFGDAGRATAVWFSAPAHMPRGLTVCTVGTGDRLHLALRWSRALLDDDSGPALALLFEECLAATAAPGAPESYGAAPARREDGPCPTAHSRHTPDDMPTRRHPRGLRTEDAGSGGNESPGSPV
ncbi:condensation protein [Streptomyces sp. V4I8]|uniref:condensation protein n=1 Tax=Streptomyces sp. V4I8 TaxID=3156469 RepID=UPI003517CFF9